MSFLRNSAFVLSIVTLLSACGGGGDTEPSSKSSNAPNAVEAPLVNASDIINSPDKYSAAELNNAADELVTSRYRGKETSAVMDVEVSQRFYQLLFGSGNQAIPYIPVNEISSYADSSGNLNETEDCYLQGTVTYQGQFDDNGAGSTVATFTNCNDGYNELSINGTLAIKYEAQSLDNSKVSLYFDNLNTTDLYTGETVTLTGYQTWAYEDNNDGSYNSTSTQKVVFSLADNNQAMLDFTMIYDYQIDTGSSFNVEGQVSLGDLGYVDITTINMTGSPYGYSDGQLVLSGDKKVAFEFIEYQVKYMEDTDNDGTYDVGTYFSSVYEIEDTLNNEKNLVDLAKLSLPPNSVGSPSKTSYSEVYTTTEIVVEPGYYYDPDTAIDELEISYRWYLNGNLLDNNSSNILPAYTAVSGDNVSVAMVVFDGGSAIESYSIDFAIEDSPIEIMIKDIPEIITAGDSINFSVEAADPDLIGNSQQAVLISGPAGASIDNDGILTWQVTEDFLFPYQTFDFTFGVEAENGDMIVQDTISIKASSNKAFPVARSGIEVPTTNQSIWIDDFDGDGQNEVLATDSKDSVFLLEHRDGSYNQKWLYPFKLPTKGDISQVLAYDLDDDDSKEIIVITDHGVSIIDDLDSLATVLFSTDDFITHAAIADVNSDGKPVLAYLHAQSGYSDNNIISVVEMSAAENVLFTTAVTNAKEVIFANVDNDQGLELILNNGLVYDGVSWLNDWISGTDFGGAGLTAGDYNGDGIDEIAGADVWGNVTVFSMLTKAQLDSFANYNACSLHSANIDEDIAEELLVGNCQWGDMKAYDLVSDNLVLQWQVGIQGYNSKSVMTGDSDNDGRLEVHWGTAQSSSGHDFVVADLTTDIIDGINVNSAVVKEGVLTSQLDSFSSAGWASIDGTNERAVFFIPSTISGSGGSRLVFMDEHGDYQLGDEVSSNWDESRYAVTTDYNNDGFGDIFLPNSDSYYGGFAAMQLFDYSTHWSREGDYDSTIGLIQSYDLNDDTLQDAVYVDNRNLIAIDIDNQQIIFNHNFNALIDDFSIAQDSQSLIAAAHGNSLSLFSLNESTWSELSSLEQSCRRILFFNADIDAELELVCLSSQIASANYSQGLIIFDIVDNALIESSVHVLAQTVIDIVIDTSTVNNQSLFITTSSEDYYDYWNDNSSYHIRKISAQGQAIWSSPELIGRPTEHGLKVRYSEENGYQMMLSTNSAMYLIN
jgi:hypothetical protein